MRVNNNSAKNGKGLPVTWMQAESGNKGVSQPILDLGAGWGCVVNATPRPPYSPGKSAGTHCPGGWVGIRAGQDGCAEEESAPAGGSTRERSEQALQQKKLDHGPIGY